VDFGAGYPQFLPDEATFEARFSRGEVDTALVVADDPSAFLSSDAMSHFARISTIGISPKATEGRFTVAMNSATPGIHSTGTVLRCDGAALPLQAPLKTDLPSDRDWLVAIRQKLAEATS
jgi:formylmethanofuran dehydrogenase subunit B